MFPESRRSALSHDCFVELNRSRVISEFIRREYPITLNFNLMAPCCCWCLFQGKLSVYARGDTGYTFGAIAILVRLPSDGPHVYRSARSVPVDVDGSVAAKPGPSPLRNTQLLHASQWCPSHCYWSPRRGLKGASSQMPLSPSRRHVQSAPHYSQQQQPARYSPGHGGRASTCQ
jgi:hypothetical protein